MTLTIALRSLPCLYKFSCVFSCHTTSRDSRDIALLKPAFCQQLDNRCVQITEVQVSDFLMYCSVPQICPPFCNLGLSTKRRGGAYTRDATISLAITLSLPGTKSLSVGGGDQARASPSARRRDAHDASSRLTSFSVEERGSRALPRSSWRRSVFAVDTLTVDSQVA